MDVAEGRKWKEEGIMLSRTVRMTSSNREAELNMKHMEDEESKGCWERGTYYEGWVMSWEELS